MNDTTSSYLATQAPQFHENHVLNGTLAFNVLMGSNWPADETEIEAARELLVELGLGDLLDRMPAGMQQMVGEVRELGIDTVLLWGAEYWQYRVARYRDGRWWDAVRRLLWRDPVAAVLPRGHRLAGRRDDARVRRQHALGTA